jgi:hypothetical protein
MTDTDKPIAGEPFDAAPFARPLPEGGLVWDDPREIHAVRATFAGPVPDDLRLEYWRGKWPQIRLPKDHVEGRGSAGWWQLGDWFNGEWRAADTEARIESDIVTFTFRPVNATEFPDVGDFAATFRTTFKLRLVSASGQQPVSLSALTDSTWEPHTVTVLWERPPVEEPRFEAFNGHVDSVTRRDDEHYVITLWGTANPDPHTFDKTLLTVSGAETVTVALEDVLRGPVWLPDFGLCVVAGEDERDYASVCAEATANAQPEIYDMVAAMPEQSWQRAWENMVPKRGRLSLPLAPDGSRHKFGLQPDGSLRYRTNNEVLLKMRGTDSDRLASDAAPLCLSFGLPMAMTGRTIEDGILPLGITTWDIPGGTLEQLAFATILAGTDRDGPAPAADAGGVCLMRFTFRGTGEMGLPLRFSAGEARESVRVDDAGLIWSGDRLRALLDIGGRGDVTASEEGLAYTVTLAAGESHAITIKVPYVAPTPEEIAQLHALDFDREHEAVRGYWRRVLGDQMQLITPEPDLNEFFTAVAGHSLINSELEPNSRRRFARAGSFSYLAFANESCMMIADLDRRGMHEAAHECLEGFLHYQGTVPLPGDFRSQEGVLWAAGGYEHLGYNQHHGWTLWCLVEHFRFTRDEAWLRSVADNVLAAADWIIRERTRDLPPGSPEAGLLPPGNLEDITDWWPWLSTNCYTWRGLDAAAWGLAQIGHSDAARLREQADDYRAAILDCFTRAAERSPVVRLRNATYVPHFPSTVYRRGRSFGWICETLEGAIHLLITGLIAPHSREAQWIINDYEDNLYLSEQYGYHIADFDRHWFDWGGFSMQACLLLDVEPYLYRDDVKHALRATFNAIAAQFHPDTRMGAEHALPELGDWRGDHYKSPDEANACGWLRYLFVREEGNDLLVGQAVPESWLQPGGRCGVARAVTHFGEMSVRYEAGEDEIVVHLDGPRRNPPARIKLRCRPPAGREIVAVQVSGQDRAWVEGNWLILPGGIGQATVTASLR